MEKADYYATLGVDRGVGDAELKKAYRKLAMQYHPDRNPGDAEAEQKFKDVSEAYDVLKDPQKRAAYDQFGHAAFENGMGGGGPGGFGGGGFDFSGSFSDIFEDLFGEGFGGRRARRNGPARGADLRFNYEVTLEQAFTGKQAEISLTTSVACDSCSGSGAAEGSQPQACPTCGGLGKTRTQQGFFTVERACHQCHGAGQIVTDPCTSCSGAGVVEKEKTLSVNIPPGVENGTRIRLAHEGEAGRRGGPPGDLYLFISVKPHPVFDRQGDHILCRVPISMATAALGGDIEVPTIAGKRVRVNIPDGTQSGRQFRLKSKGMPKLQRSGFGDMLVQIDVETPVNLTKRQKELLREFDEEGENTNPQSEGFFSRLKELWDDLTE